MLKMQNICAVSCCRKNGSCATEEKCHMASPTFPMLVNTEQRHSIAQHDNSYQTVVEYGVHRDILSLHGVSS